jgi:hypothetical protein
VTEDCSSAYFAYFPPYSYERHLGLVAKCAGNSPFDLEVALIV